MSLRTLLFAGLALAVSGPAHAQVSRVFVSVDGNDANTCSNIATPCRTLAAGISQVDAQGEVIVIDSGSYAGGTITKSVKINVASGVVAFSGLPITVDPGAGGTVVLRGLTLKAATVGSGYGITHQSGTLFVENTVVDGWQRGLSSQGAAQSLFVKGSVFRNHAHFGLSVAGGTTVAFAIDDSFFENNASHGLVFNGGRGRVSNSVLTRNQVGALVESPAAVATFQRCEVANNTNSGLTAADGSTLRISGSTIVRNELYGVVNSGATIESFGNNVIRGNVVDTSGTLTTVALQ
jgi:hypothetical protein